jgi:cytosine/adenosine deaminase-related metal-dependent hydrolase
MFVEDGMCVVHCPSANLKLGSGIVRIAELDVAGVRLALGADGAPCNNDMDPWVEMRHAALLGKVRSSPTALPAARVLRLATIDGARALGLDADIGSIEIGKKADLAVVRIDGPHAEPGGDPYSRLVYACHASDVRHVLVDGALVVKDGEHQRLHAEEVTAKARDHARRVRTRAL